jgi:hypothetical protein
MKVLLLAIGILSALIEVSGTGSGFCMGWNDKICNASCCARLVQQFRSEGGGRELKGLARLNFLFGRLLQLLYFECLTSPLHTNIY